MEFDARIPYEKLQGKHVVLGLSGGVDSSVSNNIRQINWNIVNIEVRNINRIICS